MKNFVARNGRQANVGDLVGVHWNSHKKTYSIVEMKSRKTVGSVLGYADAVTLKNCTTKIDKSKQKNVTESGVKDRHAFIVGELESFEFTPMKKNIYYNPHKVKDFVDAGAFFRGKVEYLGEFDGASLAYNTDANRPVVQYS